LKKDLGPYFDEDKLWWYFGGKLDWNHTVTNYKKLIGMTEVEKPDEEDKKEAELGKKEYEAEHNLD
jgi:hypothetical protein